MDGYGNFRWHCGLLLQGSGFDACFGQGKQPKTRFPTVFGQAVLSLAVVKLRKVRTLDEYRVGVLHILGDLLQKKATTLSHGCYTKLLLTVTLWFSMIADDILQPDGEFSTGSSAAELEDYICLGQVEVQMVISHPGRTITKQEPV